FYINQSEKQGDEEALERQTDVYEDDAELTEDMVEPEIFEPEQQPVDTKVKGNSEPAQTPGESAPAVNEETQAPVNTKGVMTKIGHNPGEVNELEKQETPKETEPAKSQPADPTDPATDPNLQPAH
ncbi:MAG: hypothetical protein K2M00_08055, partial [Muribaculaceae bacterium]|nr:hypothetical protein [Muribaculaceae bacterium]